MQDTLPIKQDLTQLTVWEMLKEGNALFDTTSGQPLTELKKYVNGSPNTLTELERKNWDRQIELIAELDRRIDLLCERSPANTHYPFKGMKTSEVAAWFGIPKFVIDKAVESAMSGFTLAQARSKFLRMTGHPDTDHNRVIPTFRGSLIMCFHTLDVIQNYTGVKVVMHKVCEMKKDEEDKVPEQLHVSTMLIELQGMQAALDDCFEYIPQ